MRRPKSPTIQSRRNDSVPTIQSRPDDSVPLFRPLPVRWERVGVRADLFPNLVCVPSPRFRPVPQSDPSSGRAGDDFFLYKKGSPPRRGSFFRPRRGSFPRRAEPIARRHLRFAQELPIRWDHFAPTQPVVNYSRGQLPIENW
jgi:hypothetical protein